MRTFLFGLVLGAIAGVLYAPANGNRTRALVRDKFTKYSNDTQGYVHSKGRHFRNKLQGMKAEVRRAADELSKQVDEMTRQTKTA